MPGDSEICLTALKRLPVVDPPAALEPVTLAAMAEAASARRPGGISRAAGFVAAAGIVAALGFWSFQRGFEMPEPDTSGDDTERLAEIYAEYAATADRLEALLGELPEPRRVVRGETALTIVGLEDRIAWLEAELGRPETAFRPVEYRAALMHDRLEAMNALVHVRYAQSRAFMF